MHDLFVDITGNISVTGPLVRIEYMRVKPVATPGEQPQLETSLRLVMPLEGFLRSMDMHEDIRKKLLADGVITTKKPAEAALLKPADSALQKPAEPAPRK